MEELKSLFGEGSLSYDEFETKLGEAGESIKLANLKAGGYVDKAKYEKIEKSANDWQTKYNALTESTKDYEELKNKYDALSEEHARLQNQMENDKKLNAVLNANVNPKYAKFIIGEVSELTDDNKDFQTALSEYLKENKEFLNTAKGTYVDLEKGNLKPQTPNEKMNNFIRSKLK